MEAPGFYKDIYHEYMIIDRIIKNEEESLFEEQMLHNQKIDGLLRMKLEYVGGSCKYYYDIQRMDSLETAKEDKTLDYENISAMFRNMTELVEQLQNYLLVPDNLRLEPVCIYKSKDNGTYLFTYVPGLNSDFKEQLKELLSWLMKIIDHRQKNTVMLVYGLYKSLSEENSIASFMREINTAEKSFAKEIKNDDSRHEYGEEILLEKCKMPEKTKNDEPVFVVENQCNEEKEAENDSEILPALILFLGAAAVCILGMVMKSRLSWIIFKIFGIYVNSWVILFAALGAAGIMTGVGIRKVIVYKRQNANDEFWQESQRPDYSALAHRETTVLRETKGKMAETETLKENILILKRLGNIGEFEQEIIYVTCVPFTIGKEYGLVQYQLNEKVVSRRHAEITKENGQYFITDLSSTNGTRLNHERIKPGTACILHNEDIVEFANIAFEVKIKEGKV